MAFISSLKLYNFRCYEDGALAGICPGLIALHGPNGAGKTNILEALSLLTPGRGLRGARAPEMQNRAHISPWAVSANIETSYMSVRIGTGRDPQTDKRTVRINGETAKAHHELTDYLACVWLTPQMDRLFLDSARERRRFLDRLVFAFDPGHSASLSRYDNAMAQRSRLLREGRADPAWLNALEGQMAQTGVAVAAARAEFSMRLQAACESANSNAFPRAALGVKGEIEDWLQDTPALEVEEAFAAQLSQSRGVDMLTGGAATGPHKSDLIVSYIAKGMPASHCSTGEQKALLIGLILAHARLIKAERGAPPLLLLDEVAAHLDEDRRGALYELLEELQGQVWLTGTDEGLFESVQSTAQFLDVRDVRIAPAAQACVLKSVAS
ncbi:MAG: DNA replication/repair protein RecF [Alphaproteobacteria bacterium]|nr:DNA replication/repair protein RecF [Alphaproteobacteria bacterium]